MDAQLRHAVGLAFGEVVRRRRGNRKQIDLADKIGVNASTWSLYESGKRIPENKNFTQVAEILGLSRAELIGEIGEAFFLLKKGHQQAARGARLASSEQRETFNRLNDQLLEGGGKFLATLHTLARLWAGIGEDEDDDEDG